MKNVLVVDDETTFRLSLAEALAEYADDFKTLTAGDGEEAVGVLRSAPVDVLVTDLRMPVADGFELLAHVATERPDLPVVVMTAYGSAEVRQNLEPFGVLACLEKPIDFAELVAVVKRGLNLGSEGRIRGIRLPAFVQLLEIERKTCTLQVTSGDLVGHLFFRNGQLIDADSGTSQGEAAAYEIVTWDDSELELDSVCPRTERRIHTKLSAILMDAFRILDEATNNGGRLPAAMEGSEPSRVDAPSGTDGGPGDTEDDRRKEAMSNTQEALARLADLTGVTLACLVGRDGFLLDSSARSELEAEATAAIAASGFGASESMGRELDKGRVAMAMVEFESGPVLLSPVGDVGILVVVAEQSASLGMIRLQVRRLSDQLLTELA